MVKSGNTFYIILGTLNFGPKSGYDIKKDIERSTGNFYKINYGQIYPLLKNMVDEGYVTLLLSDKDESRHERKVYELTEKGRSEFLDWLSLPVNFNNPHGNELLAKLFFGKCLPVRENINRLHQFKRNCLAYLEKMKGIQAEIDEHLADEDQWDYSMITVRHGQMTIQAKIDWCDECIQRLSRHPEDK